MNIMKFKVECPSGLRSDVSPLALEKWNPNLTLEDKTDNTINILEVIGEDFWTGGGVTAKRISAALRSIGADEDVVVNINSPGGDMFEGLAIYNLLKQHKGEVTIKVLSLAASAASIIAMAADKLEMGKASFLMIHNAWIFASGNRNDFKEYAEYLEPFDMAMADLYSDKTGMSRGEIIEMMDKESWIGAADAIEQGFADSEMTQELKESDDKSPSSAIKKIDIAMAKSGMTRAERRKLLNELKTGTRNATEDTHNAIEPLPRISFSI